MFFRCRGELNQCTFSITITVLFSSVPDVLSISVPEELNDSAFLDIQKVFWYLWPFCISGCLDLHPVLDYRVYISMDKFRKNEVWFKNINHVIVFLKICLLVGVGTKCDLHYDWHFVTKNYTVLFKLYGKDIINTKIQSTSLPKDILCTFSLWTRGEKGSRVAEKAIRVRERKTILLLYTK